MDPYGPETFLPEMVSEGYQLLARAFLDGPTFSKNPMHPNWLETVRVWDSEMYYDVCRVFDVLATPRGRIRAVIDFRQRLNIPVPGQYIAPYSSVYLDSAGTIWGPSARKVLDWYIQGGMDWNRYRTRRSETVLLAPDHIGLEWAFLSEIESYPEDPSMRKLAKTFLKTHVHSWLPKFRDRWDTSSRDSFYGRLTAWAERWVDRDMRRLEQKSVVVPISSHRLHWF